LFLLEGYHRLEVAMKNDWPFIYIKFFCTEDLEDKEVEQMKQVHNYIKGKQQQDSKFTSFFLHKI
jgi:hypothetical protein